MEQREIDELVRLLKKLEPGFLPLEVFYQIARLITLSTVELVVFRRNEGKTEVFLSQRPEDDPFWAKMWHVHGSVVRSTDKKGSFESAFSRLQEEDFSGLKFLTPPKFVDFDFRQEHRGSMLSLVHWVKVEGEANPDQGRFFPVENLPEEIVPEHIHTINTALDDVSTKKTL